MTCVEDLDDAKECLRGCNNVGFDPGSTGQSNALLLSAHGSLLNDCLDPSRSSSVESLDSLIDCCEMSASCEHELTRAQDCVQICFDPCIKEKSEEYLDCIDEESELGSNDCDRQQCLNGFLDDLENDANFEEGDILDLTNVEARVKTLNDPDLHNCLFLEDFVDGACDIGEDCCESCLIELSYVVDCLLNDVVIPFVAIERNETIDVCPITEDCELAQVGNRKLNRQVKVARHEEALFNKALGLPTKSSGQTKRDLNKEAAIKAADKNRVLEAVSTSEEAVEACQKRMEMNTIAHNVTYAVSVFMQCVSAEAISRLGDEPEDSGSAVAFRMASLVSALAGGFLFF